MIKKKLQAGVLSFAVLLLAGLLTVCMIAGSVILDPHTYKRAAREDNYLQSIEKMVAAEMQRAAAQTGLPEELLKKHTKPQAINKLAKRSAADAALVLKGRQVIYGSSFDRNALLADMNQHYREEFGIPAEGTRQQALSDTASAIQEAVNTAVRVMDMEQIASDPAFSEPLSTLTFLGQGGILLTLLLMAVLLVFLYLRTNRRQFSHWLWGIGLSAGVCHLVAAGLVLSAGLSGAISDPDPLALLWKTMVQGVLTVLLLTAVFWLFIAFLSLRYALGKPILPQKLQERFVQWRAKNKNTKDDHVGETTDPADASKLAKAPNALNATNITNASDAAKAMENTADLSAVIRKAAADSLNTVLWRRRK